MESTEGLVRGQKVVDTGTGSRTRSPRPLPAAQPSPSPPLLANGTAVSIDTRMAFARCSGWISLCTYMMYIESLPLATATKDSPRERRARVNGHGRTRSRGFWCGEARELGSGRGKGLVSLFPFLLPWLSGGYNISALITSPATNAWCTQTSNLLSTAMLMKSKT
jgi:hypothetical protein